MIEGMGRRLLKLRCDRRLTREDVAAALGLAPSTIANYETSESTPRVTIILKLASFYRCSVDYLFTGKTPFEGRRMLDVTDLTDAQYYFLSEFLNTLRNDKHT